jgi:hypothetical protein
VGFDEERSLRQTARKALNCWQPVVTAGDIGAAQPCHRTHLAGAAVASSPRSSSHHWCNEELPMIIRPLTLADSFTSPSHW